MTKDIAFQKYLEKFMTAEFPDAPIRENDYFYVYPNTSVPDNAILPYMTYEGNDSAFLDEDASTNIKFWIHTDSELIPNKVARDFRKYIETNDIIACDEGLIWIKPGSPFSTSIVGENMTGLKGRSINLEIERLTEV